MYINIRPGVEEFLKTVSRWYEVAIFSAGLKQYADPVIDYIDPSGTISARLFRESCTHIGGYYIKDLRKLGRDLKRTVIIDNSPMSYFLQPENAIAIPTWFDDHSDQELYNLIPVLEGLAKVDDIPNMIRSFNNLKIEQQEKFNLMVVEDSTQLGTRCITVQLNTIGDENHLERLHTF